MGYPTKWKHVEVVKKYANLLWENLKSKTSEPSQKELDEIYYEIYDYYDCDVMEGIIDSEYDLFPPDFVEKYRKQYE